MKALIFFLASVLCSLAFASLKENPSCYKEAYTYFNSPFFKNLSEQDANQNAKEYCSQRDNGDCLKKAFGYFYGYMNSQNYQTIPRDQAFKISEAYCSAKRSADCLLNSFLYFYSKDKTSKSKESVFNDVQRICTMNSIKMIHMTGLQESGK
ncbi:hypothetical protein [Bdellovibrio bacteriovorus]|uniref:hypothetical protein n=1 Tax=Bdellovibrio TaxID=958 RepID=UPI0035A8EA3D